MKSPKREQIASGTDVDYGNVSTVASRYQFFKRPVSPRQHSVKRSFQTIGRSAISDMTDDDLVEGGRKLARMQHTGSQTDIPTFNPIKPSFYRRLQQKQIQAINKQLDGKDATNSLLNVKARQLKHKDIFLQPEKVYEASIEFISMIEDCLVHVHHLRSMSNTSTNLSSRGFVDEISPLLKPAWNLLERSWAHKLQHCASAEDQVNNAFIISFYKSIRAIMFRELYLIKDKAIKLRSGADADLPKPPDHMLVTRSNESNAESPKCFSSSSVDGDVRNQQEMKLLIEKGQAANLLRLSSAYFKQSKWWFQFDEECHRHFRATMDFLGHVTYFLPYPNEAMSTAQYGLYLRALSLHLSKLLTCKSHS